MFDSHDYLWRTWKWCRPPVDQNVYTNQWLFLYEDVNWKLNYIWTPINDMGSPFRSLHILLYPWLSPYLHLLTCCKLKASSSVGSNHSIKSPLGDPVWPWWPNPNTVLWLMSRKVRQLTHSGDAAFSPFPFTTPDRCCKKNGSRPFCDRERRQCRC